MKQNNSKKESENSSSEEIASIIEAITNRTSSKKVKLVFEKEFPQKLAKKIQVQLDYLEKQYTEKPEKEKKWVNYQFSFNYCDDAIELLNSIPRFCRDLRKLEHTSFLNGFVIIAMPTPFNINDLRLFMKLCINDSNIYDGGIMLKSVTIKSGPVYFEDTVIGNSMANELSNDGVQIPIPES